MKNFVLSIALAVAGIMFAFTAQAIEADFGWKPEKNAAGKVIGMSNIGEQGGKLTLTCDVNTHRLKMSYTFNKTAYDMYVFRKFGVTNVNDNTTNGKFIVGAEATTQSEVYYNIFSAKQVFSIARFEIGSKAKIDAAVAAKASEPPLVNQEGDETFIVGTGWEPLLKNMTAGCPFDDKDDTPIF